MTSRSGGNPSIAAMTPTNDVFLAPSKFLLDMEIGNYPEITFHFTSEFKTAKA